MRGLGDHLADQGHMVLGMRLAGHGREPEALRQGGWRDWLSSVDEGFARLQRSWTRVMVIGFSMGGALALLTTHQHQALIDRLVVLSMPFRLSGDWRTLPLLRHMILWYYPLGHGDFDDPRSAAEYAQP
ncbi:MAG: alpha/beta fold hydrolase [Chloroflexaceae bacterium]|nr:alpha/beta fold hydrolase [Chloroflexaceae bacterium]